MLKHVVALIAAVVLSSQFVSAESVVVPSEIPTLDEAIDSCGWNDTIWLAPGTYSGPGFSQIYCRDFRIFIIGQGGAENTVIDAGGDFFISIVGHKPDSANELRLEHVTVKNGTTLVKTEAIWGLNWIHLHHSIFTDSRVAVRGGTDPGLLCVVDCQFLRNDTAVAVYSGVDWADLSNSRFVDNGIGLFLEHIGDVDLYDCVFTGNDSAIVSIGSYISLLYCVLYRNQYGLVVDQGYFTDAYCNDVYGSTIANFVGTPDFSGIDHNINVDPMFCDPTCETGIAVAGISPLLHAEGCGNIGDVYPGCTCCLGGTVGDLDFDIDHSVTMGDLTMLIDNLFISYTPLFCPNEANLDGDPAITMGDLTVLIDHLFNSYDPLPPCP